VDPAIRRDLGAFFTPPALAARVVEATLAPLLAAGAAPGVCDPACGDGVFLVAAARLLAERLGSPRRVAALLTGYELDAEAAARARAAVAAVIGAAPRIHVADALRARVAPGTFDAVVGNPPWVSYSGRQRRPLPAARRAWLAAGFETFAGWPSLHGPFTELAVRWSRSRIGLLLPAQVCDLDGYGPLRAFLRRHGRVEEPCWDLGEKGFDGVTQPCCALLLDRGPATPGGEAPFRLRAGETDVLARLAGAPRPPAEAFGDIGVHTGNCAHALLAPVNAEGAAPVREGRDVHPFRLDPPRHALHAAHPRATGEYFRIGALERYRAVPILLRQTAARPVAALHDDRTYFRNSVIACRGIPGVPDEWVVAWLNSSVVAAYHAAAVREAGQRAFPQVKLKHLRDLPMPPWDRPPPGLPRLARTVARTGCAALVDELDALVTRWFA